MKRLIPLILVSVFLWVNAAAQDNKIEIIEYYHKTTDTDGIIPGTMLIDQNGDKCAIIKVMTTDRKYTFSAGSLGIHKTIVKNGEIWVYVSWNTSRLILSHPNLETLEYILPEPTEAGQIYIMKLKSKDVFDNTVDDYSKSGTFNLEIYPQNANIDLNAISVKLDTAGKGAFPLYYGRYTYNISADMYHTYSGTVQINDNNPNPSLKIRLKQAYGWLNIICKEGLEGAKIYVDDIEQNVSNTSAVPVASGRRKIKIDNPLYFPYEGTVNISDSTTSTIQVTLKPNYGTARLISDNISEIYLNSTLLGQGKWEGPLPVGTHMIECRAQSHTSSFREITVEKDKHEEYLLSAPTPIYGFAEITSNPEGAEVYIDNVLAGTTPFMKGNILIGIRNITLRAPGYTPEKASLTVFKDSLVKASYTLSNRIPVKIESYPSNSTIYIDGTEVGKTPFNDTLSAGKHHIKIASTKAFKPIDENIYIDNENSYFDYALKENLVRENEFYAEGIFSTGNASNYGGAIGGYINKFNLEAGISIGMESDPIYWNKTGNDNPSADVSTYKPTNYWFKAGYGFPLSSKIRFTPQIGAMLVSLTESFTGTSHCDKSYAMSAIAACRINYAISTFMGIGITPEYKFNLSQSAGYETLSGVSPQIADYAKDFNIKLGIYFFF